MTDKLPDWALEMARAAYEGGAIKVSGDIERWTLINTIAHALVAAELRGREDQKIAFIGWLRPWVKKRFGKWITYHTAIGAYADYEAAIRQLGSEE